MPAYQSEFSIGQRVIIDGDRDMIGTVTGVQFFPMGQQVHVAWMHQGSNHEAWIDCLRLTPSKNTS